MLMGAGSDIWNTSDSFYYTWQTLPGDGYIAAHTGTPTYTDAWAKAGLMIRASADPAAPFFDIVITPNNGVTPVNGVRVEYRTTNPAGCAAGYGSQQFGSAYLCDQQVDIHSTATYLKVQRTVGAGGSAILQAYTSSDGSNWNPVGGAVTTTELGGSVLAGMAITSHSNGVLAAASFDTVTSSGLGGSGYPNYSSPLVDGTPVANTMHCPSPDLSLNLGISPSGTQARGQTVAEANPFDPNVHATPVSGAPTPAAGEVSPCVASSEYHDYSAQSPAPDRTPPPLAPWIAPGLDYQNYNLYNVNHTRTPNYRPYNGRWVDLYIKIPDGYNTSSSSDYYAPGNAPACTVGNPGCNPNPGYWYVQYVNKGATTITDRTTWEVSVVDEPPHLIQ